MAVWRWLPQGCCEEGARPTLARNFRCSDANVCMPPDLFCVGKADQETSVGALPRARIWELSGGQSSVRVGQEDGQAPSRTRETTRNQLRTRTAGHCFADHLARVRYNHWTSTEYFMPPRLVFQVLVKATIASNTCTVGNMKSYHTHVPSYLGLILKVEVLYAGRLILTFSISLAIWTSTCSILHKSLE